MKFQKLFDKSPLIVQNILISVFNFLAYKKRYGGVYKSSIEKYRNNRSCTREELLEIQEKQFQLLKDFAIANAPYYKNTYKDNYDDVTVATISKLPILSKAELKKQVENFYTLPVNEGYLSKTGGTTGKSLEVVFTNKDLQDRFAMLDDFRNRFGYKLGKRTAWLSGKTFLTEKDVKKNRFWKTDVIHKIRYYSTFHIKDAYLKYYILDLIKYKPEYISGFPTAIMALASYGLKNDIPFPENLVKAIFTTSETLTPTMREAIQKYFKAPVYNQYSASEGAPFIFECVNHNLHVELQSGVFEVLDEDNNPATEGRLVVTSFSSYGTPLIRYDIGDSIALSDKTCSCGNNNPLVREILGRNDDFVYSPQNGKIHLTNIANSIKDVKGIGKMQIIQNKLNALHFLIVDDGGFDEKSKKLLIKNWRERVGDSMELTVEIVPTIDSEKSGKFRVIKNSIKHLIP